MKTIQVNITAEFEVPDDWEIIDHAADPTYPEEKLQVLKINDKFYDFFPECLMKVESSETAIWSTDEGKTEDIIDCMTHFKVKILEKK